MEFKNYISQDIQDLTLDILKFYREEFKKELVDQGHKLTGKLIRTIEIKVNVTGSRITGTVSFEHYSQYLERGVQARNIPFGRRRGSSGGVSKYIEALIGYFKKRGLSAYEAKRAAFATATIHSREGMPTRASRRFSKSGARTGFINRRVNKNQKKVAELFVKRSGNLLEIKIQNVLKQFEPLRA